MGGKVGHTDKQGIARAGKLAAEIKEALLDGGRREKGLRVEICGSIRRKVDVVGDIDIVVNWPLKELICVLEDWGQKDPNRQVELLSNPATVRKTANLIIDGMQVDLYFALDDQWGAMTLFLTGSRLFNIVLRGKAKKIGYKLNQYGLWHGDEIVAGKTEEQIFYALGIDYMAPEERSISYRQIRKIPQKEEMLWQS